MHPSHGHAFGECELNTPSTQHKAQEAAEICDLRAVTTPVVHSGYFPNLAAIAASAHIDIKERVSALVGSSTKPFALISTETPSIFRIEHIGSGKSNFP